VVFSNCCCNRLNILLPKEPWKKTSNNKDQIISEENQFQVKERDPSATLGQYGEAEKLEDASDESAALYQVSFDAKGECELLPNDNSRVLNTQSVKEQKTKK